MKCEYHHKPSFLFSDRYQSVRIMEILGLISVPTWLFCLCLILLSLYLYTAWCQSVWKRLGVPGPEPVPFLGIMNRLFKQNLNEVDMDLHKQYGRVVGVYQGNIPVLLVADPELIKQITVKEFSNFTNRFDLIYPGEIMANGVNAAHDDHWKFLRNTLSPTFSTGKLKNMMPLIQNNINTMLEIISEKSSKGESMEMKRLFGGYTMDVIASTAFGLEVNSLKNPDDPFVNHAKIFFSGSFTGPFLMLQFMFPRLTNLFRVLKISFFPKSLLTFFEDVINKTIQMRKEDPDTNKDFLQLMLNTDKERTDSGGKHIKGLTRNEIYGNSLIFMVAGYDTTANTLTFGSYCLATNPDVQDKLIEEIDREIADKPLEYENVMSLEYLDMFISEVLRLWAPTPR
ncbi:hypothetical protein KUTeg_017432 [Tegillarca granosa]|uniref:Cytochrome P450 n=1 Tax=Tegillarca granosa TaxID=220873 RepID=A0ABQ9EEW9_TEGGR|nr:hypothetical protein KUTeg_017432 [Tegillarca granosa]